VADGTLVRESLLAQPMEEKEVYSAEELQQVTARLSDLGYLE